ncbi:MAG TPA: efflux transporter outer membrane subunit [Bacteroidia bacterium]|jgi:NodT family efflux transporter outer membrane factor (OMF) lipoprotein
MRTFARPSVFVIASLVLFAGCKLFDPVKNNDAPKMPQSYSGSQDTTNSADIKWRDFFADKNLVSLIDTALKNNFDMLIALQDIQVARNELRMRSGMLFPTVEGHVEVGQEKVGHYTSQGAGDASAYITPGNIVPEHLNDFTFGLYATWEVDIWKKLRNAKKASYTRYLASMEGRNFVITNLVAEICNDYYELLSLDNQLDVIRETIKLQQNALEIVRIQKEASVVSELAVKKFEAEVLNSQSREYDVLQQIKETENRINFLLGRFPQPVIRDKSTFMTQTLQQVKGGVPSQLLANRPDIKQTELELFATKCDVKVAQAEFYPSFNITGSLGFDAFKTAYLLTTPESFMYSVVGGLVGPLINRNAIKAEFNKAKAYQLEALYNYQKTILNAYMEVSNELSNIDNLGKLVDLKNKEVETLVKSIDISNDLFKSARADYFEVLMTQRDALESKLELLEWRKQQYQAMVNLYRALGGGWR